MSTATPPRQNAACGTRLSLPVLAVAKPKKSRSSRRRAIVLSIVYVLMIVHFVQWYRMGMTISPIEPSESMSTLERGFLNAGFIFFSLALLSTFVFGRYFCGWGCHIVALQDLCSHWMTRLGVRPRPWRTRLLLWCPLLLGLYMFVYPNFERFVLVPLMHAFNVPQDDWPFWMSNPGGFPGLSNHLVTQKFWATFPEWYVAVPYLLICGFATVYFLGSKAFCTFGCPYGGFFGVVDRVSIGRIVVNDSCEQCGHCTAACTSNVRVHQEVHDFGMVVDPGCMKCMDCVSVCPNDALSFGFAKPAILAKPRAGREPAPRAARPSMDLSWPEEIVLLVLAIVLCQAFRGMLNQIPLLMAAGMSMIATFGAWKLWRLIRDPNVRVQSYQLKIKGRITRVGLIALTFFAALLGLGAWSGWVRFTRLRAELAYAKVSTPYEVVMAPGYSPKPEDSRLATRAIKTYLIAGPISRGGFGWGFNPDQLAHLAWLSAVAGDLPGAEGYLNTSIALAQPSDSVVFGLAQFMTNQHKPAWQVEAALADISNKYPEQFTARITLARVQAAQGRASDATCEALRLATDARADISTQVAAGELLIDLGRPDEALRVLTDLAIRHPDNALAEASLARALYFSGEKEPAIAHMRRAAALAPDNAAYWGALGELLAEGGLNDEAAKAKAWSDMLISEMQKAQGR